MRAVMCRELTGPEGLTVEEIADPVAGEGDVVVRVDAASMNFLDYLITLGRYQVKPELPFTPGAEGAGVIESVGAGVDAGLIGQKVLFWTQVGAFAEKLVLPAMRTVPLPDHVSTEAAAALTITYGTTLHALADRGQMQAGETLLVLGAAGGVGLAAIHVGKAMGARVIAAASSDEKLKSCKDAGADVVINYSNGDLRTLLKDAGLYGKIDVVYDPVGGDYSVPALRAMAPGGRLLVIGFAAGGIPEVPLNMCLLAQVSVVGVFFGAWALANPKGYARVMGQLFDWIKDGSITPHVGGRYSLDEIESAYSDLTGRKAIGKLLVVP